MTPTEAAAHARPRVEGDREREILEAALEVLADVGYDRLTMDAVAARGQGVQGHALPPLGDQGLRSSSTRCSLQKGPTTIPDTGSLRGDLLEVLCGMGASSTTRPWPCSPAC